MYTDGSVRIFPLDKVDRCIGVCIGVCIRGVHRGYASGCALGRAPGMCTSGCASRGAAFGVHDKCFPPAGVTRWIIHRASDSRNWS